MKSDSTDTRRCSPSSQRCSRRSPVFFVDADGNTTHVVLPITDARRMFDDYLRRELQVGFAQADRGEFVDWDADRVKTQGRQLLRQQPEV